MDKRAMVRHLLLDGRLPATTQFMSDSGVYKNVPSSGNITIECPECGGELVIADSFTTHRGTTVRIAPHTCLSSTLEQCQEAFMRACDSSVPVACANIVEDATHADCVSSVKNILNSYDEHLDDTNMSDYLKIIKSIIDEGKTTYHDSCMPVLFDILRKVFMLHDGKSFANAYYVGRVLDVLRDTEFDSAVLDELIKFAEEEAAKKGKKK